MARWLIADEGNAGDASSSESEESEVENEQDTTAQDDHLGARVDEAEQPSSSRPAAAKPKITLKLGSQQDVCHVCGKRGHTAGFVGAKYIDCPNKPCYLCGTPGHSTMTCPYRVAPGHGCVQATEVNNDSLLTTLRKRERGARPRPVAAPPHRQWHVDAAVLKLHSRRVTCLEFHPRHEGLVLSGDKRGQIAVWDFDKVYERTVYSTINRWQTNVLRFMPGRDGMSCATASHDGTVKVFDVETAEYRTLFTANTRGWDTAGADDADDWVTAMGMDVVAHGGAGAGAVVVVGDSVGNLHVLDPRLSTPVASMQLHKKGTKVQSVAANPVNSHLLLTAGNDYVARLLDIRNLTTGVYEGKGKAVAGGAPAHPAEVAGLPHSKVINSAYFSPITGRKILTTCQDNRIRVWDYVYRTDQAADREVVHSQNFNRYLTPFRAEWDPKDPAERLLVCGRYISEDFGGIALHPIDLLDAATGELVGELTDPNLTTISPVNKPHPRRDVIISGSSRSLYAWRPKRHDEGSEEARGRSSSGGGSGGGGSSSRAVAGRHRSLAEELPFGLQASGNFVFFDADEDGSAKKKQKKSGGKTSQTTTAKAPSPASGSKPAGKKKAAAGGAAKGAAGGVKQKGRQQKGAGSKGVQKEQRPEGGGEAEEESDAEGSG